MYNASSRQPFVCAGFRASGNNFQPPKLYRVLPCSSFSCLLSKLKWKSCRPPFLLLLPLQAGAARPEGERVGVAHLPITVLLQASQQPTAREQGADAARGDAPIFRHERYRHEITALETVRNNQLCAFRLGCAE